MNSVNVLVTGGAGFIGSHLASALVQQGCNVTVIDNLSTGRWMNIKHLQPSPNFKIIVGSARESQLIQDEVAKTDLVYHLASSVGVKLIVERPVETVETIFHTTDVVLNACSRYRKPIVITSTSEVYGKSEALPFQEDADVVMGPTSKRRWAYACAKALDEFLALAHFYETSLPVFITRLFNTVGARQTGQYGMVLPTFVRQALLDQPLTVYGSGEQRRCFCSVLDVVEALLALPATESAVGKVVNVGSTEEVSMAELARRVIEITNSNSTISYVPYDQAYGPGFDDMMRRIPDTTRARDLLGWQPKYSLDQIIAQVIDHSHGEITSLE